MEPTYKSVDLLELRGMLRRWQKRGVTSAHCTKLLMLLIGERDLMGEDYGYHQKDFNALRIRMGFKFIHLMLEAVRKSDDFIIIPDVLGNVNAFYSPLFPPDDGKSNDMSSKELFGDESIADATTIADATGSPLVNNLNNNNNYADNNLKNIFTKEQSIANATTVANASDSDSDDYQSWDFKPGEKKPPKRKTNPNRMEPTDESRKEADDFFHAVKIDCGYRAEFMDSIISYYTEKGYEYDKAVEMLVYIVNEELKPFFASRRDFMEASTEIRVMMLRKMVFETSWIKGLRNRAEAVCRERRQKKQMEFEREIRERGTHGAYELVLADGSRFYEDPDEGTCPIPPDAPDRPGSDYFYDYCLNEWRSAVNE